MKNLTLMLILGAAALGSAVPAQADDLSEASAVLCSTSTAVVCTVDGSCESGPPWAWNVPDFVEIDLQARQLRATEASGEHRVTPVEVLRREAGLILLQGMEKGRAFSVVISEDIGGLSAAIVREDLTVNVFGSCTPLRMND
jgi:hypothetical protein